MALLWLLLGVSAAIGLFVSYYWIKYGVPILALLTSMVGVSVFLFSVAWVIKSMYNGEPLAASSGLITFWITWNPAHRNWLEFDKTKYR